MNPEAQKLLDEILKKNPRDLTEEECVFLRARRGYLKDTQLEEYKLIINPNPEKDGKNEQNKRRTRG